MKTNYWSPRSSSSVLLLLLALFSVVGIGAVELLPAASSKPHLQEKLAAAELARQAMDAVKAERLRRGLEIDAATDLSQSGLIGQSMSSVTSNNGSLPAKQTSINPNFAAVVVDMLKQAGVREGDTIAVGLSGSFPAINLSVLAAAETLKLKAITISSTTASQWGANVPEYLWIDMEKTVADAGLIRNRSVAASLGGIEDKGIGVAAQGLEHLRSSIDEQQLTFIQPHDYLDSVNQRMNLYHRHANGENIKAYINVGGGTVSVGTKKGKKLFEPGLNSHRPLARLPADSVMARFSRKHVPVIHLVNIDQLATQYGLPLQPAEIPRVGEGTVYSPRYYNKWLAAGLLTLILAGLVFISRQQRPFGNISRAIHTKTANQEQPESITDSMPL